MNLSQKSVAYPAVPPSPAYVHAQKAGPWQKLKSWLPLLCCGVAASVQAADDSPACGALRIKARPDDLAPAVRELPLKHTQVEAEISGWVTRVNVTQVFENPCTTPIEAVYVFPLPQNAAVNDMSIRIGDRLIKGEIKKRAEARKIYEDAKQAGKTAALLDQERPNIFSQSVANIMPGNEIQIEITYDEVLTYEKGGYEFVFPMVVGPRFIPGSPTGQQGGGWSPDTDQVPDASRITPPVLKPGERNGHDIEVVVRLNAGLPVQALNSPSHEILVEPAPIPGAPLNGPAVIRLAPRDTVPNKDFVLRYEVAGQRPEMALLTNPDKQGGTFMLMFQPPEKALSDEITPKEMVFVMDCSGSMDGEPIALAKQAVKYALNHLNPDDTFHIIRFSESASPFAKRPLPATPENIRRGLSYVNGLSGEGGTMMLEGIKSALDYPPTENRLRMVCFMTDGFIGNETEILAAVEKKLGDNTRLFSFGVGSSVNRYLLERLAEVGRGEVHYVLLNEKPDKTVEKFYERVRNPVLTHIRIDWGGLKVADLSPARIKDLFTGQPIFLMGRYRQPVAGVIRVLGKMAGCDREYPLTVTFPEKQTEHSALAALWARSRIRELEAEQYGGENPDVVKAITELALSHRLMSPYTSFVAVEEKVVNEGGQMKTIQVPVEMPDGVSFEGVFGQPGDGAYPSRLAAAVAPMGGFAAKRMKSAPAVECAILMPEESDSANRPDARNEPEATPMPDFELNVRLDATNGTRLLEITSSGEIWETTTDSQAVSRRVLVRRMEQSEKRALWEILEQALQNVPASLNWTESGQLDVTIMEKNAPKTFQIPLQKGPLSTNDWTTAIRHILR